MFDWSPSQKPSVYCDLYQAGRLALPYKNTISAFFPHYHLLLCSRP